MDDFVMGKWQHKVFAKGIDKAKSKIVLMMLAVDWFTAHKTQSVIHPTHVPFDRESQTAHVHGMGNTWPCSRFLCDGQDTRKFLVNMSIEFAKEMNGFKIFAAT